MFSVFPIVTIFPILFVVTFIFVLFYYIQWAVTLQIIKRANESGENDPLKLSNRFSNEFLHDMAELQCLPPTHEPRVSDHMDQIIDMISKVLFAPCPHFKLKKTIVILMHI